MTPEGAILKQIMGWLAAEHILAFRMNTLAMPTADGKRFIKAGVKGMADVLAFPKLWAEGDNSEGRCDDVLVSVPLWIECKSLKGKQSEFQKSFQQQVEAEGHRYVVSRSIDDVKEALK